MGKTNIDNENTRKGIVPEQGGVFFPVPVSGASLPPWYGDFLNTIKSEISVSRRIWPDEEIVQRTVAQLSWRHNICLMEKFKEPNRRLLYAAAALKYGWSHNILDLQQQAYTIEREGKLPNNFDVTLPNIDSDMMKYLFKDPSLRHPGDAPTIGLLLVKNKNEVIVRYSLESVNKPIGVASWETELNAEITDKWKSSLPTIEDIEYELKKTDDNDSI